jgi:hypothetical protein
MVHKFTGPSTGPLRAANSIASLEALKAMTRNGTEVQTRQIFYRQFLHVTLPLIFIVVLIPCFIIGLCITNLYGSSGEEARRS